MAAFAASPEAKSVPALRGTALALLARGNLGGALVAQLRAAELAPKDADVLMNAAALATNAGMPNEALGLLDGARRADTGEVLPYGADRRAVAAQIRGMAQLQLGQTAEAAAQLASVPGLDPALEAESASGEANAAVCKGDKPLAIRKLKKASKRKGGPATPLSEQGGHPTTLRPLGLPAFPRQAAEGKPHYDDLGNAITFAETDRRQEAEAAIQARLRAQEDTVSPAQRRRTDLIWRRINAVHERPAFKAMQDEAFKESSAAEQVMYEFFGNADLVSKYSQFAEAARNACSGAKPFEPCRLEQMRQTCTPAMKGDHQTWLSHVVKSREASARYVAAVTQAMTGLAANLDDPDQRALVALQVQSLEDAEHLITVRNLQGWGHYAVLYYQECVESPQGIPADDGAGIGADGDAGYGGPDACNAVSKQLNFTLDVSKLVGLDAKLPKLKANCERIQISYEFGPSSWAQAFAQVDWKYRAGTVTAYVGVRGKVEFQTHNEQLKGGLYLTASKNGVEDMGWRTSASTTRALGPVFEITTKTDWDISFVPAFQDLGALVSGT
jgi:tetratricopeptide (TPR) repeat protein